MSDNSDLFLPFGLRIFEDTCGQVTTSEAEK